MVARDSYTRKIYRDIFISIIIDIDNVFSIHFPVFHSLTAPPYPRLSSNLDDPAILVVNVRRSWEASENLQSDKFQGIYEDAIGSWGIPIRSWSGSRLVGSSVSSNASLVTSATIFTSVVVYACTRFIYSLHRLTTGWTGLSLTIHALEFGQDILKHT